MGQIRGGESIANLGGAAKSFCGESVCESKKNEGGGKVENQKEIRRVYFLAGSEWIKGRVFGLLAERFTLIEDEKAPDYVFYSVFETAHINYDCVRIFVTGENVRADFNFADYGITFDYLIFEDRHLRYPFYLESEGFKSCVEAQNSNLVENAGAKNALNRGFCSFVVSNGKADPRRDEVFERLSAYKFVASGGKYRNNVGGRVGDKRAFLAGYKFNIAFENSQTSGYVTEKIFDAKAAGSVPIYFGCPKVAKPLYSHELGGESRGARGESRESCGANPCGGDFGRYPANFLLGGGLTARHL